MREIVLDTETTGFEPKDGHRLVEIGCVEIVNFIPTGRIFHTYLNPGRDVPPEAVAVHGLTDAFLADKPTIDQMVDPLLAFLDGGPLVIHNAEFDLKFINAELKMLGYPPLAMSVVDTVLVARKKFPGQPANLDALCRRFKIDLTERTLHGALLDAQLLAEVYLELMGGRQQGLALAAALPGPWPSSDVTINTTKALSRPHRTFLVPEDEKAAHDKMIASLGEAALWQRYQ